MTKYSNYKKAVKLTPSVAESLYVIIASTPELAKLTGAQRAAVVMYMPKGIRLQRVRPGVRPLEVVRIIADTNQAGGSILLHYRLHKKLQKKWIHRIRK